MADWQNTVSYAEPYSTDRSVGRTGVLVGADVDVPRTGRTVENINNDSITVGLAATKSQRTYFANGSGERHLSNVPLDTAQFIDPSVNCDEFRAFQA